MKKWFILWLIYISFGQLTNVLAAGNVELVATHPSDETAFTQGLEVNHAGQLLMGTGLYGESVIGHLDIKTGKLIAREQLAAKFFGEGLTQTPFGIWQLTWREGIAFLRDTDTLAEIRQATYTGEGWGLAYDDERQTIWMSNGSSKLQQRHAETFEVIDELAVTYQDKPVERLNELEYANGYLYANIWQTYIIVKIDLKTGKVLQQYDLQPIVQATNISPIQRTKMDVLNGIAHIEGERFYLTGKRYPFVFEVILSE